MNISEHRMPMYPGEILFRDEPKSDDARMIPWLNHLRERGVVDENYNMLVKCKFRRGAVGDYWLIRAEWEV